MKTHLKTLLLLAFVVLFTACSSTPSPTPNDPQPNQQDEQLTDLVGDWTGTLTNTNCLPSSSTNVTLKLRNGTSGLYGTLGNSEAVMPVFAVQVTNEDIGIYDNLDDASYSFSMQLEATGQNVLTGTFSELSDYACGNSKTVGRVYLQK